MRTKLRKNLFLVVILLGILKILNHHQHQQAEAEEKRIAKEKEEAIIAEEERIADEKEAATIAEEKRIADEKFEKQKQEEEAKRQEAEQVAKEKAEAERIKKEKLEEGKVAQEIFSSKQRIPQLGLNFSLEYKVIGGHRKRQGFPFSIFSTTGQDTG